MSDHQVKGFRVRPGLAYDLDHHMWVEFLDAQRVRVGMDPLGVETSGTLAQLSLLPVGTELRRGESFGSLEAEKFVGPLVAPISGRVLAVNDEVGIDPGRVEKDPYEAWLVELAPTAIDEELPLLVHDEAAILAGFEAKVIQYRIEGVLAE